MDHPEQSWRICQMRLEIIPGDDSANGHMQNNRFLRIWHTTGQAKNDYMYEHEIHQAMSSTNQGYDLVRSNHGFGNATGSSDRESMWFFQASLTPSWDGDTTTKRYHFCEALKAQSVNSIKWRIIHTTENYHPYTSSNNEYPDEPVDVNQNPWHGATSDTLDVVAAGNNAVISTTSNESAMMTDQIKTADADITVFNGG